MPKGASRVEDLFSVVLSREHCRPDPTWESRPDGQPWDTIKVGRVRGRLSLEPARGQGRRFWCLGTFKWCMLACVSVDEKVKNSFLAGPQWVVWAGRCSGTPAQIPCAPEPSCPALPLPLLTSTRSLHARTHAPLALCLRLRL